MPLRPGVPDVIHVDLSDRPHREACAGAWLDEPERDRRARTQHPRARRQFVLCRAALRAVLCDRLDCANASLAFGTAPRGKPFALVDGLPAPVHFNVSHGGDHGLIALSRRGRVGVDVEERTLRHDLRGPVRVVFAPRERTELDAARGEEKVRLFFRLWTLKEAFIKALGTGFSVDTSAFEIPPALRAGAPDGEFRCPRLTAAAWRLENLGDARFAAAMARELVG